MSNNTKNTKSIDVVADINYVKNNFSIDFLNFLKKNCNIDSSKIIFSNNINDINCVKNCETIINLSKINNIRYINKYFEEINKNLKNSGRFISCVEDFYDSQEKKYINKIPIIKSIYFFLEFIFFRLLPKIKIFQKFYFYITNGKNRLISKSEMLGRLISCGFEIIDFKKFNGLIFVVASKKSLPKFDMNPSYGPVYKMPRIGKNKKIIHVYKIRTMHPYSEYLQKYMFEKYGSKNGDKVNNDFRISNIGATLRKFWIDELPMIINLFKGDIKLVGVRPLSISKFEMYPKFAQERRILYKPGLLPPFYADMPNCFEELVESEMRYIDAYEKSPILTDLKYFFISLKNIIFRNARSK